MIHKRRVVALTGLLLAACFLASCTLTKAIRPRVKSPVETGDGILFRHYAPSAMRVNCAGDFNQWCDTANGRPIDITMDPMEMDEHGIWWIVIPLEVGTYQYKFIVDGGTWQHDTNNLNTTDDSYGGQNSILTVKKQPEDVPPDQLRQ